MTDAELSAAVVEADGKVSIGFKDPNAVGGVDDSGLVLASASSLAAGKALLRDAGIQITFEFITIPAVVARMPAALLPSLRRNPVIDYIEPIFPGTRLAQGGQTIPWNVQRVEAPDAWAFSSGSGAKLLIIDSGIDDAHPDLAPAVIQACDGSNGLDIVGHGTWVAGVAAAFNNNVQIVGVAPDVALWTSKDGDDVPTPDQTACGVQFGRINGVDAINISTGYPAPHTPLTDQINGAYYQDGIVVVVAAGNTGGGAVTYPATLDAAIAVSATDTTDNFAAFSAAGPEVELTAPGTTVTDLRGITTTCLGGVSCAAVGGPPIQGTSFSTPHVAAAAALLKAYDPSWSNVEIRTRLTSTAIDLGASGRDDQFGYGLLDILAAMAPPGPSVSIVGPTSVKPDDTCLWEASVTGTPPFQYLWKQDGAIVGTGSQVTTSFASSGTLQVEVWDPFEQYDSDSKSVTVSSSAPHCFFR